MTAITTAVAVSTMTSLELVDFINLQREVGEAVLQHRDFFAKAPKVLGEGVCEKFRTPYRHPQNGQVYGMLTLPKREACLMAMSYSYELQAKVFDRMTALDAQQAPAVPQTMAQALRLAADQAAQFEQLAPGEETSAEFSADLPDSYERPRRSTVSKF